MNKNVNIQKKIDFTKDISEITAISLENNLEFIDNDNIEGYLIVSGKYKTTLAAQLEEDFNYKIPIEITLTDSLDLETASIDISDFSYDIVDDKYLLCNVDLSIEGDVINTDRECDGDIVKELDKEIPKIENNEKEEEILEEKEEIEREEVSNSGLFNIDNKDDTYGTFIVYIVRENETINTIISKYNTSLEEIEKYNDIKDITIGKKLIIPLLKDDSK